MSARTSVRQALRGLCSLQLARVQLTAQMVAVARNACPPGWARQGLRCTERVNGRVVRGAGRQLPARHGHPPTGLVPWPFFGGQYADCSFLGEPSLPHSHPDHALF